MDTIAPATPALPAELRHRRVRLEVGQATAAYACGHVRSAIAAWSVPVNPALAVLLTSDLVINAVTNGAVTITLGIRWLPGQFRVEVHDVSVTCDSFQTDEAGADTGRGLLAAASTAAECGHYRTPAGRAVYYVLALGPWAAAYPTTPRDYPRVRNPELAPRGAARGDGES